MVITKPNVVNLTNLTRDDVKYLQSPQFDNLVKQVQQHMTYDRTKYRDKERVDNINRYVFTKYFEGRDIKSTQALSNAIRRLIKQLDKVTKEYSKGRDKRRANSPFIIVYYNQMELR